MIKYLLPLLPLLATSLVVPVQAIPVCYMDTVEGDRVDLTNMCGTGEPLVIKEPPASTAIESPAPLQPQLTPATQLATFQVRRINRETGQAQGVVRFTNAAEIGQSVSYWADINGQRRMLGSVMRERGQSNVDVNFWLPAGTSLNDVQNEGAG